MFLIIPLPSIWPLPPTNIFKGFPSTWMIKCLPTMLEAQVRSLGGENPLEKEMTTHSSTFAWKIQWTEEPGGLQSMRSQRVGHDWVTSLHSSLQTSRTRNTRAYFQFSSVQSLSHVWHFTVPWIAAHQASLSITNSRSVIKLMPIDRWCHPAISFSVVLFPSCPQSLPVSGSFSNESTVPMRWPKYWSFQLQHQSFQWAPRTDHL